MAGIYGQGLAVSALVTGILLALLGWGLYQFRWGEEVLEAGIWALYGLSALAGGFWVGKRQRTRRFLWGMGMGLLYFLLLSAVSGAAGSLGTGGLGEAAAACGLCLAGGMLGGMVS